MLAPLWDDVECDNAGGGKYCNYKLDGVAPNRVLTLEWHRHRWQYNSSDNVLSFQCKLYETTNVIEFNYLAGTAAVLNGSASIGINSQTNNQYLSLNGSTGTSIASSSTSTTNISAKPTTDRLFRFSPHTAGSNILLAPTAANCVGFSSTQINLSWTDNATNELGYEVYYSTNAAVPIDATSSTRIALAANTTSTSITGLTAGTTYYFKIFARKEGLSTPLTTSCVPTPPYAYAVTAINYGSSTFCSGDARSITVTLQNTGSATWLAAGPTTPCAAGTNKVAVSYKWGSDLTWYDTYPNSRNPIPSDVAPGGSVNVTFNVESPIGSPLGANTLKINLIAQECLWFTENYTSPSVNFISCAVPVIATIPSAACVGSTIAITGTNLSGASSVTVNGVAATITSNTATLIEVTAPAGASGTTGNIVVTNGAGADTEGSITVNPLATAGTIKLPSNVSIPNGSTTSICAGNSLTVLNDVSPTNGGSGTLNVVWYINLSDFSATWIRSTDPSALQTAVGGVNSTSLTNYNPQDDFSGATSFYIIRRAYTNECGEGVLAPTAQYIDQGFYLNLTPQPVQPSIIGGTTTPCLGSSQTYTVTNVSGFNFNWIFPSGWVQTGGGTTNSVTATVGSGSGNISVTASNICNTSSPRTLGVAPTGAPTVTISTPSGSSVCNGVGAQLVASGSGSYTWSPATGLSSTSGATVTATPSTATTYTVTEGTSGCNSTATVNVGIGAIAVSAAANPTIVCAGGATNLTSILSPVTILSPTGEGGFEAATSTFAANNWVQVGPTSGTTWYVGTAGGAQSGTKAAFMGTNASTYGSSATASVRHIYKDVVIPAGYTNVSLSFYHKMPTIDDGWDYFECYTTTTANTPVDGVLPGGGYTLRYSNTSTSYTNFTLESGISLGAVAGTTVRVVFTLENDGASPHANPAIDAVTITGTPPGAGHTFSWSSTPSGFSAATQNASATQTVATTYTVTATNSATGCTATASTANVTIRPIPSQPSVIAGNTTPCNPSMQTYTVTNDANVDSYNWTFPTGWTIVSGGNTNSVTAYVQGAVSGNISVIGINVCGTSPSRSLTVSPNNTAPIFSSCADVNINSSSSSCGAVATWSAPVATDACTNFGAQTATFSTPGTSGFVVPAGVTSINIKVWGAGGGGGGATGFAAARTSGGGGGGGYSEVTVPVTPFTFYPIAVGQGGSGGAAGVDGGNGGTSSFGSLATATGGNGGGGGYLILQNNGPGGSGGTGSTFNGGNGAAGTSGVGGGGGGGSAGASSNGGNASGITGGTAGGGGGGRR